eukprot:comp21139_c0_seq1/m.28594 comp21139_c0_seq1/g.28594  ORF comp21139_c0_seq1/g.28594 comp21139_c0_seq1/m.28594 type:complete len:372 (-) comp21139_c0_seq1:694-1809(-)
MVLVTLGIEGTWFAKVLPSLITMLAMTSALTAVRFAQQDQLEYACWSLLASAIFDGLDGHVARALKAASAFGAELDSLCDLVDFGVAPALVLYQWCRFEGPRLATELGLNSEDTPWHASENFVWITCMFYAACCACRLARFNLSNEPPVPQPPHSTHFVEEIEEDEVVVVKGGKKKIVRQRKVSQRALIDDDGQEAEGEVERERTPAPGKKDSAKKEGNEENDVDSKWLDAYINRRKFFEGVPAPMGAYLALTPLMYWFQYGYPYSTVRLETLVASTFIIVGLLMISTLRTFSSKMLIRGPVRPKDPHTSHLRSRTFASAIAKLAAVGVFGFVLVTDPWRTLLAITTIYVVALPLGQVCYSIMLTDAHAAH